MKKAGIFVIMFLVTLSMVFAQDTKERQVFAKQVHNFGKIPQGTPVTYEFEFTNVTNSPIVIEHVQSTCGCTVPHWTRNPVPPGESGVVAAQFNAANMGNFKRHVTVHYREGGETKQVQLFLEGEVIRKDAGPENHNILRR